MLSSFADVKSTTQGQTEQFYFLYSDANSQRGGVTGLKQ